MPPIPLRGVQVPGWLRRSVAVAGVLILAKVMIVLLRAYDGSRGLLTSPLALASIPVEDLEAALLWAGLDALLSLAARRLSWHGEKLRWLAYAALAIYAASNVPVTRMFATPLTYPILMATDVALLDSLRIYVTAGNVLGIAAVLLGALLLPGWPRLLGAPLWPLSSRARLVVLSGGLGLWFLGWLGHGRLPLRGLHRNVVFALVRTTLLQRGEQGAAESIEIPPLPAVAAEDDAQRSAGANLDSLAGSAAGRDVLWVVMESTAARYLKPFGAAEDPTPNLTRLAQASIAFDAIYAAYPESIKGLFSLLCSANPAAHTTAARYTQEKLPCPAVAQRFAAAGYKTAMFHSGWFLYLGMDGVVRDRGFDVTQDAGAIGGAYKTSFGVDEETTVQRVLAFFDALRPGQAAFVMYLPIAGHHPYRSPGPPARPRPFGEKTELDGYRNDLYLGDAALGTLMAGLAARGRLSRMAIVLSGDHGEAFQQHEGNFGHTLYLYDENLRVPLLLLVPGVTDKQGSGLPRRIGQPGSVIDIAPTLLQLAGLPVPAQYQGRSLLRPAAADEVPRFLTDHAVYQVGLRQGPWKFIDEPESGRSQLFDLRRDPEERRDLAATQPQRVARYREHLRAWSTHQRLLITSR